MEVEESKEAKAAKVIQRFLRQYRDREVSRQSLWHMTWNVLDIKEEHATVKTEADIEDLLNKLQKRKQEALKKQEPKASEKKLEVPPDYKGPRIGDRITLNVVAELISFFKEGGMLPYKYAHQIVSATINLLQSHATAVNNVSIPTNGRTTVCGDLHGQLQDLITIFRLNGLPADDNGYVFNGDFVDRGAKGVEVLILLFALKILFPKTFFLNRGNHEQRRLNRKYGFEDEVRKKYDADMYNLIEQSFLLLPLCSVIEKKILILHGGLFSRDGVKLSQIQGITLPKDLPKGDRDGEDLIMEDMLWSDPRDIKGREESSRGAGVHFGADVSAAFLNDNGLDMLIRSHEVQDDGYFHHHHGKVVTVFSCSKYCGTQNNKGAFIAFEKKNHKLAPSYHSYMADPLPAVAPSVDLFDVCQKQTLAAIRHKIFENRHDLLFCFTQLDKAKQGKLKLLDWSSAMRSVLNLSIPWIRLRSYFVEVDQEGKVDYAKFLRSFRVSSPMTTELEQSLLKKICKKIYSQSSDLRQEFAKFDKDNDGSLTYVEFAEAMQKFDIGLTKEQLFNLMQSMDTNKSNTIEFDEFLASFQLEFSHLEELDKENASIIKEVGELLHKQKLSVKEAFHKFDKDNSKGIGYDELSDLLRNLGLKYDKEKCLRVAQFVDKNKSGNISYGEFKKAFTVSCSAADWQVEMLDKIAGLFLKYKMHLQAIFRFLDLDGSGTLDEEEFREALHTIEADQNLSDAQIKQLFKAVDKDGNGEIAFENFLESFKVVDQRLEELEQEKYKTHKKKKRKHKEQDH